jgi:ABC-2 type transport system permease protein
MPLEWASIPDALRAEWTKARTVTSTIWLLVTSIVLNVALGAGVVAVVSYQAGADQDPTKLALTGIEVGQALIVVLAVRSIDGEYRTGMICTTLAAIPRRATVLAAKAALLASLVFLAGAVAVLGNLLIGRLVLPGHGFTPAHGYAVLSLTNWLTLRAAAGSVLYLVLIALLSLGIAAVVRDSAASIGVVLGLLYLFPIFTDLVTDPAWQRHLEQISPMTAGLAIQATTNLRGLPIEPWAGLGVLAAWAAATLLAGGLFFRLRDA